MAELLRRTIELSVDTIKLTGHRIAFDVVKTKTPDPNQAEIMIYNLTDDQRKMLTDSKTPLVRLAAGYESEGLTQLFVGKALHVLHEHRGAVDIVTTISTSDGGDEIAKSRINVSFGPATKIDTVLRAIVKALGLKDGNVNTALAKLRASRMADIYLNGTVISGSCASELTHLCRSAGLEWSVQDGALQFADLNQAADQFAIRLTPETGLIGSPSISNKGVVSGQCFIANDLKPGRQMSIESRFVNGNYIVAKVRYRGDTEADDWLCDFEATKTGFLPKRK